MTDQLTNRSVRFPVGLAELVEPEPASQRIARPGFEFNINGINEGEISIYNILGEVIYTNEINQVNSTIDISSLTFGKYFIQVESNGKYSKMSSFVKI